MRRYVIEVPDDMVRDAHPQTGASVISGPGTALVQNGMHGWLGFIPDAYVVDAETIPDPLPLPTEPGVRFWGKTTDDSAAMRWSAEPAWWFVMNSDDGRLWYQRMCAEDPWREDDAERWGLVRLPDPEDAP